MFAFIFVYSPTTFTVRGIHPLKRFQRGTTYERAETAIAGGKQGAVGKAIYVIGGDADDLVPQVSADGARATVDYDQVNIAGKDDWPWLTDGSERTKSLRDRLWKAFPDLDQQQLTSFVPSISVKDPVPAADPVQAVPPPPKTPRS